MHWHPTQCDKEAAMIKIVASHSMKVPAEGEYSSKSFHVGLEAEIAETAGGEGILAKTHELFALAKTAVNNELNGKVQQPARETIPQGNSQGDAIRSPGNGGGVGNGDSPSSKQLNFLLSLARKNGGLQKLQEVLLSEYGVAEMNRLTKRQCSELIERMKGGANARR
jgi:hypothetical protein